LASHTNTNNSNLNSNSYSYSPSSSPALSLSKQPSFHSISSSDNDKLDEKIMQIRNDLVPPIDYVHEEDSQNIEWRKPAILHLNRILRKKITCVRPQYSFCSRICQKESPIFLQKSLRKVLTRMKLLRNDKLCLTCFDDQWKRNHPNSYIVKNKRKSIFKNNNKNNNIFLFTNPLVKDNNSSINVDINNNVNNNDHSNNNDINHNNNCYYYYNSMYPATMFSYSNNINNKNNNHGDDNQMTNDMNKKKCR